MRSAQCAGASGRPARAAAPDSAAGCRKPLQRAITLIELLVVITIIGLVTAVSLPAIRGIGQSNIIASGSRQLIDDLALARQFAINNRCTVDVLFMGPVLAFNPAYAALQPAYTSTNLLKRQYTSYIIFAERSLGDQPGQAFPRYLTAWRSLPEGMFIAPPKFNQNTPIPLNGRDYDMLSFDYGQFPFPRGDSKTMISFAFIQFDPSGRLLTRRAPSGECVIPLTRGSIFLEQDPSGAYRWLPAVPFERPRNDWRFNPILVVIDATTGRARLERPELQ